MELLFIPVGVVIFGLDPISQTIWLASSFLRPRFVGMGVGISLSSAMMLLINGEPWAHAEYVIPYILAGALWTWLWGLLANRLKWKTLDVTRIG